MGNNRHQLLTHGREVIVIKDQRHMQKKSYYSIRSSSQGIVGSGIKAWWLWRGRFSHWNECIAICVDWWSSASSFESWLMMEMVNMRGEELVLSDSSIINFLEIIIIMWYWLFDKKNRSILLYHHIAQGLIVIWAILKASTEDEDIRLKYNWELTEGRVDLSVVHNLLRLVLVLCNQGCD